MWTAEHQSPFFKESKTLLATWRNQLLLPEGVNIRVGRWEVPGRPIAILVHFNGIYAIKDQIYKDMWNWYGVDSLHSYGDYDEACAFSIAAAYVIKDLADYMAPASGKAKVIAHLTNGPPAWDCFIPSTTCHVQPPYSPHMPQASGEAFVATARLYTPISRIQRRPNGCRTKLAIKTFA